MPVIASTSGCLHSEFAKLFSFYFYKLIGKLTAFLQLQDFSFHNPTVASSTTTARVVFSSHLKSKVDNILVKVVGLRVTLNIDGSPIASRSHTHPSHSQTSRLLTSSLILRCSSPPPRVCEACRSLTFNF